MTLTPIPIAPIKTSRFVFNVSELVDRIPLVEFRGNNERIQTASDQEIILTGPTRTGKTRAVLHKVYTKAIEYPGLRALILRKTRASLTETTLVTFERDILGVDHPLVIDGPSRSR